MKRSTPLRTRTRLQRRTGLTATTGLSRAVPLRPVSARRARENRERRRLAWELWGGVQPRCARPGCPRMADNIHEILPRARSGGIITDPSIWAPLCDLDNEEATREDRNEWAYEAGLLFKSWQAGEARAAGLVAAWRTEAGGFVVEAPAGGEAA